MSAHNAYFAARSALINAREATDAVEKIGCVMHAYWWREVARGRRQSERRDSDLLHVMARNAREREQRRREMEVTQ